MSPDRLDARYRRFAAEYNRGVDATLLAATYDVPEVQLDTFVEFLSRKGYDLHRPPEAPAGRSADAVDYQILGTEMQFVEVELDPGESTIAEAGAMMVMDAGISMETILGDGSQQSAGVMDKLFGAGKRILTGESLFMTAFTNSGATKARVAFAAPFPGRILALDLAALGGAILCQKQAFLAAARGVTVGIAFQRRLGVGFFGGEGFILERLAGDGLCFVHAGGTLMERDLAAGERLRADTGCLVAMQPSVDYDIQLAGGIKTALFGGEGLFLATLTGPGRVLLQSLPFSRLADRVLAAAPRARGKRTG